MHQVRVIPGEVITDVFICNKKGSSEIIARSLVISQVLRKIFSANDEHGSGGE